MSAYGPLAGCYDLFTGDVPYGALADFYEKALCLPGREKLTLLDLCCGTGTLACILARRGHEIIGTDVSEEMLALAQEKAEMESFRVRPMFLCQEASELDLYGTVEGAYCSLDAVNYIPWEDLTGLVRRLHLFIEPGGKFAFDMQSPQRLRELDGQAFVDEREDIMCLWRTEFDPVENALFCGMDIFRRSGRLWDRQSEEHVEYAHEPRELAQLLLDGGFKNVRVHRSVIPEQPWRLFITAQNLPH